MNSADNSGHAPQRTVVASSKELGWSGFAIERRVHDAGSWETPPLAHSMVCLYVGHPMTLEQRRGDGWRRDVIVAGMAQIVPPGTATRWQHSEASAFLALTLSEDFAKRAQRDDGHRRGSRVQLINQYCVEDPRIDWLVRELDRETDRAGAHGELYAESLATALVTVLLRKYAAPAILSESRLARLSGRVLHRVLAHIEDHLATRLAIADLAQIAGISVSHFTVLFRRATGYPPHEYVIRRRIARASKLLEIPERSIADIATAVGFYDQSHLAKHMRRITGSSPRHRRALL